MGFGGAIGTVELPANGAGLFVSSVLGGFSSVGAPPPTGPSRFSGGVPCKKVLSSVIGSSTGAGGRLTGPSNSDGWTMGAGGSGITGAGGGLGLGLGFGGGFLSVSLLPLLCEGAPPPTLESLPPIPSTDPPGMSDPKWNSTPILRPSSTTLP